MSASPTLLFVIVGRNEPLYEAEFNKRTGTNEAVTRQNYFVLHSALDLVEKAAWTSSNMYLKVVDKVEILSEKWSGLADLQKDELSHTIVRLGQPPASIDVLDGRECEIDALAYRKERR